MIKKQLEKTLKDAIKDNAYIIGTKQVLGNISKSKLVLLSKSVPNHISEKIEEDAKKSRLNQKTKKKRYSTSAGFTAA